MTAIIGVGGQGGVDIDGADSDHPLIGGRIGGDIRGFVAGGGDQDHTTLADLGEQLLGGAGKPAPTQAHVDDVGRSTGQGSGIVGQSGRIAHPLQDVIQCAAAFSQGTDGHDPGLPAHPGHPEPIVGPGGDGAGHVGAMKRAGAGCGSVPRIIGIGVDAVTVVAPGRI